MRKNSLLAVALLLAALPAHAGPFMRMLKAKQAADAARAAQAAQTVQAEAPAPLPAAAIAGETGRAAGLAGTAVADASAANPAPPLDPASPFYPVMVRRNEALRQMADAGVRQILGDEGLMLWRFSHSTAEVGTQYSLTVSLFDGTAPREAIRARAPELASKIAGALGVDRSKVDLRPRPEDGCCGSGCDSCLRSKPGASQYWTGQAPRRR